jgi:hypothetical protein
MADRVPVWSWESAIAATDVAPLTKLVCLNIARYLSSAGKGWRITVEQMARDTGMGDRAVRTHLVLAQKAGLLAIVRHHDNKGYRTATEYLPRFPANVVLDEQPAEIALPAPDAARAYRHLRPVGRRAGQVPFQVDKGTSKRDSLPNQLGANGRVDAATVNPLDAWGPEQ